MKGDQEIALKAGCDGYLTKPIDRRTLVETITHCLASASLRNGKSILKEIMLTEIQELEPATLTRTRSLGFVLVVDDEENGLHPVAHSLGGARLRG